MILGVQDTPGQGRTVFLRYESSPLYFFCLGEIFLDLMTAVL